MQRLIVEFPKHGRRVDNPPEDEGSDKNTDDSATSHGSDIETNDEDCVMPGNKEELPLQTIVAEKASAEALNARERMVREHEEHTVVLQRVLEDLRNAGEEACAVTVEEILRKHNRKAKALGRQDPDLAAVLQQEREKKTTGRNVETSRVRQRYAAAKRHRG